MRSAGFPCRLAGCDRAFPVADQTSMDALKAASAARTEHEVQDHHYHHVRLEDERPAVPYFRSKPKPEAGRPGIR